MAEGDGTIYNKFKAVLMNAGFDLSSDTVKVALVKSGYTPNIDTDTKWTATAGPGATEFTTTTGNYAQATLTGLSVSTDTANDRGKWDAADVTWSTLNLSATSATPGYAVMYDDTHVSDLLIAYFELATATNGGDYTLQWNTAGIITVS